MMSVIDKAAFYNRVEVMPPTIPSITGRVSYHIKGLNGSILNFVRGNTGKQWTLDLDMLYQIYSAHTHIDIALVKRETNGRVNSPMVAVLLAIQCIDEAGQRL